MEVYPSRIKLQHEIFLQIPIRAVLVWTYITIDLEPIIMGASVVYRRPKMVYEENEKHRILFEVALLQKEPRYVRILSAKSLPPSKAVLLIKYVLPWTSIAHS